RALGGRLRRCPTGWCRRRGGRRRRRRGVNDHVMQNLWISGAHFHRLDPLVLGGVGRNREVLIGDGAVGRGGVVFLHAEDRVRLADVPLGGVDRRRRQILGVAFRRAGRHPLHYGVAIGIGETAIVDEFAVRWIGVPRRHRPLRDVRRNRLRPRPRI